jgi:hypothetical protein
MAKEARLLLEGGELPDGGTFFKRTIDQPRSRSGDRLQGFHVFDFEPARFSSVEVDHANDWPGSESKGIQGGFSSAEMYASP